MRVQSAMVLLLGFGIATPFCVAASPITCGPSDSACIRSQLEQSVASGNIVAKIDLARALLDEPEQGSNWRRAAELLQQASSTGDAWSTSILASLYLEGKGISRDGQKVLELLVPLAAQGSVAALSGLGDLFAKGAGTVAPEMSRAARYYTRAADKGDTHGMYQLALMLLDGTGISADVPRAIELLEQLGVAGDPWVLIQLGEVYASGKAAPADRALDYFGQAAATGNAPAMVRMAQLYQSGIGTVAPDADQAKGLLEKAAATGDVSGQVLLAQTLYATHDAKDSKRAIDMLEHAAAKGDVWPATVLAGIYGGGAKDALDGPRAVQLLQPFANQGSAAALVGLGDIYAKGAGPIPTDLPRARELFLLAAQTGDLSAKNRAGFMLLLGQGGAADAAQGLALLNPVIASGDTWAMLQLADIYSAGVALPRNAANAIRYYKQAAELGNAAGLSRLGSLYRDGLGDIAADRATALDYFERAVAAEESSASVYLALMLLDEGESQDTTHAEQLLDAAAKTGNAWATTILADLLIKGDKIPADGTRALTLLEPLAAEKNPAALASLGNLYASGADTVAADLAMAFGYFDEAAALGDFGAKSRLGMMLVKGEGGKADPARGLGLLREVAAMGDGWSKLQLGDVLASGESVPVDAQGALAAYQAARDTGLTAADIKLGYLLLVGKGTIAPDPVRAAAYFTDAAEDGDSAGQVSLALLLLDGKGVKQDVDQAVDLLKLAAAKGDAWANGTLGGLYADGRYVKPDYQRALQFSEGAQNAGDQAAMLRLGMLLATGPLAKQYGDNGVELVEASVTSKLPGAVVERARLRVMGLMGSKGAAAAESDLLAEIKNGNPTALRLLLQVYRAGGPGLKASPQHAQALLDAHKALLKPQQLAFETIALRSASPMTEKSMAIIGDALGDIAPVDFSQTVQMLFWGNKNAYVYALQYGLRDAGFYGGKLSGYLTQDTITAIKRACAEQGVQATCDQGPLTPAVATLMGNYLATRPEKVRS